MCPNDCQLKLKIVQLKSYRHMSLCFVYLLLNEYYIDENFHNSLIWVLYSSFSLWMTDMWQWRIQNAQMRIHCLYKKLVSLCRGYKKIKCHIVIYSRFYQVILSTRTMAVFDKICSVSFLLEIRVLYDVEMFLKNV